MKQRMVLAAGCAQTCGSARGVHVLIEGKALQLLVSRDPPATKTYFQGIVHRIEKIRGTADHDLQ